MPSPRPRILGSSRIRNRDAQREKNPRSPAASVTMRTSDEPDCEIIKIDEAVAKIEPSRSSNSSVIIEVSRERPRQRAGAIGLVEQCPMMLRENFNVSSTKSVVAPISPSLALQFVPETSTSGSKPARNIYSRQNVVMVLPVNTVAPPVFKAPTLCTLERIDNPTEITQIEQIVSTRTGNLVSPINDSVARTIKPRKDAQKEFHEMRKQILQEIFKNDITDKTSKSNASSPISWRNRKSSNEKFNNQVGSLRTVDSFQLAETSNSILGGSSSTGSESMDIREVFVAESNKSTRTHRLVNRADSEPPLRSHPAIKKFSGDRIRASQSNASSSSVDSSDIQKCFNSVTQNSVGESHGSGRTAPLEKRNGACSKMKEHTNVKSLAKTSERPVPPLTMIADKTRLYEESIELISLSQESSDSVCLLEDKEESMSEPQKLAESVVNSEANKVSISTPEKTAESVPTAEDKNQLSSATQKSIESVMTSENKKRPIPELKEVIISIIPLSIEKDLNSSADSKDPIIVGYSSTTAALQTTELSSQKDKPSSRQNDIDKKTNKDLEETIETASCELSDLALRKPRCIACEQRFSDRTELHKHATLSHEGVQIVFCDICSDSFLTDRELQQHRLADCDRNDASDDEAVETNDQDNVSSPNSKKGKSIPGKKTSSKRGRPPKRCRAPSEYSPGRSLSSNRRPRGRPRKTMIFNDEKSNNRPKLCSVFLDSNGIKKRKPQTLDETVDVKHRYVEKDVVRHSAAVMSEKFSSAEIKKLVVPLTRLEGAELDKYLEKLATRPVFTFGVERPTRRRYFRRKKGTLGVSSAIVSVRRSQRNLWPKMKTIYSSACQTAVNKRYSDSSDSDSDGIAGNKADARKNEKDGYSESVENTCSDSPSVDIVTNTHTMKTAKATLRRLRSIEEKSPELRCSSDEVDSFANIVESDVITDDRKVIRKLTSRSSASSLVALEINQKSRSSTNLRKASTEREETRRTILTQIIQGSPASEGKSSCKNVGIQLEESTLALSETNNDEARKKTDESIADYENERQREGKSIELSDFEVSKASSVSQIPPRRTYLPTKRNSKIAKKKTLTQERRATTKNATKIEDLCRQCDAFLKKLLADQFGGKKIRRTSLACPCCDMHFISMFYLEKHVARNHLSCKSDPQCSRSKNSVGAKSHYETKTDHRTEGSDVARSEKIKGFSRLTEAKPISDNFSKGPRATRKQDLRRTIDENSIVDLSDFQCWVCDLKFDDLSECNFHMREVHRISQSPTKNGRFTGLATTNRLASPNSKAVFSNKLKLNTKDQTTVDREYLLKQLLSDDSMDGFDGHEGSTVGDDFRKVTVELKGKNTDGSHGKKVIGLMSSAHTCRVCSKEFHRTQDLLMHNLSHETEDEPIPRLPIPARTVTSSRIFSEELFVDPSTNDDIESDPANESEINDNQSSCETTNEYCPLGEDSFVRNGKVRNDDVAVTPGVDEAPDRIVGEKRRADMLEENPRKSTNRKPWNPSKKSRCDIFAPSVSQEDTERRGTLEEFLDTEKGLSKADGANVNDRVPIECGKCNRQFPSQSALNEHLFFLHDDSLKDTVLTDVLKTEEKSVRRWRCRSCRQDFKQLQSYGRHRYRMHGDESMVHVCENCCKILTTVTMVNVHICTDVASYNCRTCEKTFSTGMSLRLHNTEKHMETDERHVCKPCNKTFLTQSMLTRHEKSRHRLLRPYRPRKGSPVMMAEHGDVDDEDSSDRTLLGSENCALYSDGDEDCGIDLGLKKNPRKLTTWSKVSRTTEQCDKSGKRSAGICESSNETNPRDSGARSAEKSNYTTKYIDEREIHQCCLCRIYCLTKAALDSHTEKIHSGARRVCQLCRKMYVEGGLIRHLVDEHISPCETYEEKACSMWDVGMNAMDRDIDLLVRILGMDRLMSMWNYRVSDESSINCPTCEMYFSSKHMYRFHLLMNHDTMCVLCNIEFKSGEDAAKHKKEEHRSTSCYIWFVDRILRNLTAVKDFQKIVERSFIEIISRDSADSDEDNRDSFETKESKFSDDCSKTIMEVENKGETELEENDSLSEDLKVKAENDDKEDMKIMLVVTDDDLDKYDIGKRYPNIWGLASKISSTCEEFTPKDIKEMLDTYFEN